MVSCRLSALLLPLAACGCVGAVSTVAHAPFTAVSVARVPFKAGGKLVDWTTTSPSERDRAYVRKQRKAEEREARERRDWTRHCRGHQAASECRDYTGFRAAGRPSSAP